MGEFRIKRTISGSGKVPEARNSEVEWGFPEQLGSEVEPRAFIDPSSLSNSLILFDTFSLLNFSIDLLALPCDHRTPV